MKLYYVPGACSLASHIALYEAGLSFEIDRLNVPTKTTSTGEDYLSINPKGYVPALGLDDGSILTEGTAILQYIADQKPELELAPKGGTIARYRLQEWLNYIATEIHKSYSPLFNKATSTDARQLAGEMLAKRLGYVETALTGKPYLMAEGYSVADIYLFVVLGWSGHVGFDLAPFPHIADFLARLAARPAVQAAMKAEGLR